mmetsp:Transcript_51094/g.150588  ORF Transcript_51094/g.150588 Transcript_51094/m.150588 type:complete len:260 (-) Transcript_51094:901-1680(-)
MKRDCSLPHRVSRRMHKFCIRSRWRTPSLASASFAVFVRPDWPIAAASQYMLVGDSLAHAALPAGPQCAAMHHQAPSGHHMTVNTSVPPFAFSRSSVTTVFSMGRIASRRMDAVPITWLFISLLWSMTSTLMGSAWSSMFSCSDSFHRGLRLDFATLVFTFLPQDLSFTYGSDSFPRLTPAIWLCGRLMPQRTRTMMIPACTWPRAIFAAVVLVEICSIRPSPPSRKAPVAYLARTKAYLAAISASGVGFCFAQLACAS